MPVYKSFEIKPPSLYERAVGDFSGRARELLMDFEEAIKKGEPMPFSSFIEREAAAKYPIDGPNRTKFTHTDIANDVLKTVQGAISKGALQDQSIPGIVHPSAYETGGVYQGFVGGTDAPGERRVFQYIGDHAADPNSALVRTRPDVLQTNPTGNIEGFGYDPITMMKKDDLVAYKKIGKQDLSDMSHLYEETGAPKFDNFQLLTKLNEYMSKKDATPPDKAFVPNMLGLYSEGTKSLIHMANKSGKLEWVHEDKVPEWQAKGWTIPLRKDTGKPTTRVIPIVKEYTIGKSEDGTRHELQAIETKLTKQDLFSIKKTLEESYGSEGGKEKSYIERELSPAGKPIRVVKDAPALIQDEKGNVIQEIPRTKSISPQPLMEVDAGEWPGKNWTDPSQWPEGVNKGTWYQNPVKIGHIYDQKGARHMLLYHPQGGFMTNHGAGVKMPLEYRRAYETMLKKMGRPIPWGETKNAPVVATSPIGTKINKEPMNYVMPKGTNIWGKDTTTIDAIIAGDRTSTTRGYWHNGTPKVGGIIEFSDKKGKTVTVKVDAVEKIPEKIDMAYRKDWEASEGWDMEYAYKQGWIKPGYDRIRYHKIDKATPPLTPPPSPQGGPLTPLQTKYAGVFPDDLGKLNRLPEEHQANIWAHLLTKDYAEVMTGGGNESAVALTERGIKFFTNLGVKLSNDVVDYFHGIEKGRPIVLPYQVSRLLKTAGHDIPEKLLTVRSDRVDRFRDAVRTITSEKDIDNLYLGPKDILERLRDTNVPEPTKNKLREYLQSINGLMDDGLSLDEVLGLAKATGDTHRAQGRFRSQTEYIETYGIIESQQLEKRRSMGKGGIYDYTPKESLLEGERDPFYASKYSKATPAWYEEGQPTETFSPTTIPGYGVEPVKRSFEGMTKAESTKLEGPLDRSLITTDVQKPPVLEKDVIKLSHNKGHKILEKSNYYKRNEVLIIDRNKTGERVNILSGIEGDIFNLYDKLKEEHLMDVLEGYAVEDLKLGTPLMDQHINTYRSDPRFSKILEANDNLKTDRQYEAYKESLVEIQSIESMGQESKDVRAIEEGTGIRQETIMSWRELMDQAIETDIDKLYAVGDPFISLVGKLINSFRDPLHRKAFDEIMSRLGENAVKASAMNMTLYHYTVDRLKEAGIDDVEARRLTHNFLITRDTALNPVWDEYQAVINASSKLTEEFARQRGLFERMSTTMKEFNLTVGKIFGEKGERMAEWTNQLYNHLAFYPDLPPSLRASFRTELIGEINLQRNKMINNRRLLSNHLSGIREEGFAEQLIMLRDELEFARANEKKPFKYRKGGEFVPATGDPTEFVNKLAEKEASKHHYAWLQEESKKRTVSKEEAQAEYADILSRTKMQHELEGDYETQTMRREKSKEIQAKIDALRTEFVKQFGADKWKYIEHTVKTNGRMTAKQGELLTSTINPQTGKTYLDPENLRDMYSKAIISSFFPTLYDRLSIPNKLHKQIMEYTRPRVGHVEGTRIPATLDVLAYHYAMVETQIKLDQFLYARLREYDVCPRLSMETKKKIFGMDNALTNDAMEGIILGMQPEMKIAESPPTHRWSKDIAWDTMTGVNGELLTELVGKRLIAFQPEAPFNREILHSAGLGIDIVGQRKQTYLIPENVFHALENIKNPVSQLLYPINAATAYWKSMAIGANIVGFNWRNLVGDTMLAGLFHPGKINEFMPYIGKSINLLMTPYRQASMLKKGEKLELSPRQEAYWRFLTDERVLEANFMSELKGIQNHSNPLSYVLNKMREVQSFRENILRTANTLWMLDKLETPMGKDVPGMFPQINTKGMPEMQAIGAIARAWQVDYEAVSLPYQRWMRNFLIPFGLWPLQMSKNVWKYAFSGFSKEQLFSWGGAKRAGRFAEFMIAPGLMAALWNSGQFHENIADYMPGLPDDMRDIIRSNGRNIRRAEQRLNTNDRNTLHATWGFEKGGSIKMFNLNWMAPSEVLFGTKIFNKIITQASMALMGEKSLTTAMKDAGSEWLGSEWRAGTIWLTPLVRFAIGYANGKDTFDKSRVYSAYDMEKLSWQRRWLETFDFALKCFIPPIGTATTGNAKYMTGKESVAEVFKRAAGYSDPYGFWNLIGATQRYVGLLGAKPFRPDILKELGIQANEVSAIVGEDIIKAWIVSAKPLNEFVKSDQYRDAWKSIKELYPPGQFEQRLPFISKILENKIKDPNTLYLYFKRRADKATTEQERDMWTSRATMAKSLMSLQSFKALPWTMKGMDYPE